MGSTPVKHSVLNVKAVVAAFYQEKALVGAFSVITDLRLELFQALDYTRLEADETGLISIYLSRYLSIYVSPAAQ